MKIILITLLFLSIHHRGFTQQNTIENLQEAYQEEANSAYQFDLYSDKARKDGYDDLSRLFCAVSEAEYIHMRHHQKMLQEMGINPASINYEKIKVGSSTDNLKKAINNEAKEKKLRYKKYTKEAKEEHLMAQANSFKNLKKVEANHEYLFKKSLFNLDKNIPEDYYVSNLTGEIQWNCKCIGECKCASPPKPKQKGEVFIKF